MIAIEEINGEKYTAVWHIKQYERPVVPEYFWCPMDNGSRRVLTPWGTRVATALPALPRHPKPEDAPLLYLYMAEGIIPIWHREYNDPEVVAFRLYEKDVEIDYATHNGEQVEIAIRENDNA